ncbi:MAG: hypothetical protein AAGG45_03185, partial [Pseudomonadota bacterium]
SENVEARTLVNFRAGWENENFGIYIAGNNLFDEDYTISEIPNLTTRIDPTQPSTFANALAPMAELAQFGDPRTFSLQLEARF